MTILYAYDKEYYMRKETTWHCNCKQLASSSILLPEDVVSLYVSFLSWPFFLWSGQPSRVNPIAQLGVIPQHNTVIVKWPRSKPSSYTMVLSTSCVFLPSLLRPQVTAGAGDANFPCRPGSDTHKHVRQKRFGHKLTFSRKCIYLVNSVLSNYCFSSVCPSYN